MLNMVDWPQDLEDKTYFLLCGQRKDQSLM